MNIYFYAISKVLAFKKYTLRTTNCKKQVLTYLVTNWVALDSLGRLRHQCVCVETTSPFSALTATEALCYPRLVVVRYSVASTEFGGNSISGLCYDTNKSVRAYPTHPARAQIPAVLKKNYKTAGIAPLYIFTSSIFGFCIKNIYALISSNCAST